MQLFGKDLEEWDKERDLLKEIEEGVDEMIKNSTTTFYNVVSNVDEMDCSNEIYFTTTDKSLAEKYIQKYNEIEEKFLKLRLEYNKLKNQHLKNLLFENFGSTEFNFELCESNPETMEMIDEEMEKFCESLPTEIRCVRFVYCCYINLSIVESTDEFDFEKVFVNKYLEDKDIKEHLKSLI